MKLYVARNIGLMEGNVKVVSFPTQPGIIIQEMKEESHRMMKRFKSYYTTRGFLYGTFVSNVTWLLMHFACKHWL